LTSAKVRRYREIPMVPPADTAALARAASATGRTPILGSHSEAVLVLALGVSRSRAMRKRV